LQAAPSILSTRLFETSNSNSLPSTGHRIMSSNLLFMAFLPKFAQTARQCISKPHIVLRAALDIAWPSSALRPRIVRASVTSPHQLVRQRVAARQAQGIVIPRQPVMGLRAAQKRQRQADPRYFDFNQLE
jgi:hypothetical protein